MKAISYRAFGAPKDVLVEITIDSPVPQAGEVLVELRFSGVNPSDVKARAGSRPGVTKPPFDEITPHSDGSGVITAVGVGVDPARVGQRVWIWNGQWQRPFGTAAEYIALPSEQAVEMPDAMSFEIGATLGIPGLTAAQTVFGGGSVKGQTLLISGGSGAVGHLAVQLATWGGATVIATGSQHNFDRIRDAGAAHVFDHADPDLAAKITEIVPNGIDRAIEVEFGKNMPLLADVMRPVGTVAVYGSALDMTPTMPFGPFLFKALKIDISLIYILPPKERAQCITLLHKAFNEGALAPKIDQILPLSDCATAHDAVAAGGRTGATLLKL